MADNKLDGNAEVNETALTGAEATEDALGAAEDKAARTWTPTSIAAHKHADVVEVPEVPAAAEQPADAGVQAAQDSAAEVVQAGAAQAASTVDSVAAFTESAIEERRKKRAGAKKARIVGAAIVGALLAVYLGGAAWFSGHFLPNTEIGSYDLSGMNVEEATTMLDAASGDYALTVKGGGLDFEVTSEDTGLRIDSQKVAQKALAENAFWTWPVHIAQSNTQDLTDAMQVTFDEAGFSEFVTKKVNAVNKKATDPTPATIAYNKKSGGFEVVPEELGTKLDADVVVKKVESAAFQMEANVEIGEDELLRPDLMAGDERLDKAVDTANGMLGAELHLTLGGIDWKDVGSDTIASWIKLGKDVVPTLNDDAIYKWVDKQVASVNTIGAKREFQTPRGDSVVVEGGAYGWQVDYMPFFNALKEAVNERTVGTLEVPCTSTAASLPDKNGVDFGSRYIDVNHSTQHAVFYDGKDVIWESDFISGSPDGEHNTPWGVYMINSMESPSTLIGEMTSTEVTVGSGKNKHTEVVSEPEYETVVQYWMPFVGNAVGFHDATWQPGFGGTMYMDGYGSHGCVNLPYDAAEQLYSIVTPGTPVISHG